MRRMTTYNMIMVSLFTALTAIGAFIKIPVGAVPFTLQTIFVLLSGALLGAKLGALSQALYMIIGLIGIPIFSSGSGPGYIFTPSFGYIVGFIFGSLVVGLIVNNKFNVSRTFIASLIAIVVIYFFGICHLYIYFKVIKPVENASLAALQAGVALPFMIKDIFSCLVVAILTKAIGNTGMLNRISRQN